jgi:hypothetical protein
MTMDRIKLAGGRTAVSTTWRRSIPEEVPVEEEEPVTVAVAVKKQRTLPKEVESEIVSLRDMKWL